MSVAWHAGAAVNRCFADASVPDRLAAALRSAARRDPRAWAPLAGCLAVLAASVAVLYAVTRDQHPTGQVGPATTCAALFGGLALVSYLVWEWRLAVRTRAWAAVRTPVGALLTASFGPRSLRVTTPDLGYDLPYAAVARLQRFGDVLVLTPRHDPPVALPMELVSPRDLERLVAGTRR
jgi:hypothetical protein